MSRQTLNQREALESITLAQLRAVQDAAVSEAILHKRVAEYLDVVLRPPTIWTTIGHGGGGRVRGAQLKAMGVKRGWPDILIIAPGPRVLGIELKAKGNYLEPDQRVIREGFMACQAHFVLCRSVDQVSLAVRVFVDRSAEDGKNLAHRQGTHP